MRIDDKKRKELILYNKWNYLKGGVIFKKMGEPQKRLNPKVESNVNRILLSQAITLLISIVMLLPKKISNKQYDHRHIIALCILRILLKKTYADYEIEMRTDPRICRAFGLHILPGKSTIQRGMELITLTLLREINLILLKDMVKSRLSVILDASGIRMLVILNWRITNGRKHESPFFTILLQPFKFLGNVMADKGYLSRKNVQFVYDKGGQAYMPFKEGKKRPCTPSPKSHPAWKFTFWYWKLLNGIYMLFYHWRSRIEAVFSALKKRYGDKLNCRSAFMRRKEMSLRLIAYNIRILLCAKYAEKNNLPLYIRVEKN